MDFLRDETIDLSFRKVNDIARHPADNSRIYKYFTIKLLELIESFGNYWCVATHTHTHTYTYTYTYIYIYTCVCVVDFSSNMCVY